MSATESRSDPRNGASRIAFARTITAIDITGDPELRGLWFPGQDAPADLAARAKLPAGGFASPLGYWLVAHDALAPLPGDGLRLAVAAPGEPPSEPAPK